MRIRSSCVDASCQRPQAGFNCAYEGGPSVIPATSDVSANVPAWHRIKAGLGISTVSYYMMCMCVFHERLGTMEH